MQVSVQTDSTQLNWPEYYQYELEWRHLASRQVHEHAPAVRRPVQMPTLSLAATLLCSSHSNLSSLFHDSQQ